MTAAKRRTIKQLRALAASTTFPEEAKSARAKADKLEASLPKAEPHGSILDQQKLDAMMAAMTRMPSMAQYLDLDMFARVWSELNVEN